ncbi:hypothetical protein DBR39_04335 [Chryseobacterium sp. KBW03]|uniref:HNH endonuclease n=1 Tax=Chryseobacterium sp. KBW03 TaxID=2153362 RepID=UPI000F5A6492|nr:HNH endonuclease [Chryseobacterium sp. KBW03]RQO40183.1 hypothetical protein DBR39_04335 [Chryseobacterium sp. KBW03]
MKNPHWTREELILALDLYFKIEYGQMHGTNPRVRELSNLLSMFNEDKGFQRSEGSVSLKLANFKRIDPDFEGKGMTGGGQLEEVIWKEFYNNKSLLQKTAAKLKKNIINDRKNSFIDWLERRGKPDNSSYNSPSTTIAYATHIEKSILKEFSIDLNGLGLFEINNHDELLRIEKLLHREGDSKRKQDLRNVYQSYLSFVQPDYLSDENLTDKDEESETEGGQKVYISRKAERNLSLRKRAIKLHGTTCMACGFNFGKSYGIWGEGFIEVHHLIPLAGNIINERITNPEKDLVVLCANCHRMVHRKKGITLTVEELKLKIKTVSQYDPT